MTGRDKFFVTILDIFIHGPFFYETDIEIKTGFQKIDFEKMIDNIKKNRIETKACSKTSTPELYKMITQSLALLTMFPHYHDDVLELKTGYPKQKIKEFLEQIWGKPVTEAEFCEILNQ